MGPTVLSEPETRYVKSGDAHIAYQVVGDGPADLIVVRGYISHVEVAWESPALAAFYRRLASFCRLILFDKRGTGLSDRVPEDRLPTLEQRMDDVCAVMEAVGSERAALLGASEAGPMCLLFAATYPERTLGLLLWGCFARYDWRQGFIGRYWGGETVDDALDRLEREWGDGGDLAAMAPSVAGDDAARRAWGRAQRLAATPTAARALLRMMLDVDVRPLLPAIRVPVVILHRVGDIAVDVSHSRYMAERIPDARYVEFPGSDHLPWIGDTEPIVAEIQELVTGTRPEPEPDRVVATVMFVDAPRAVARVRAGVEFAVGDAHTLDLPDASFDVAVAHTLVSHVRDPPAVLAEAARVIRPTGSVAVFDGDYSSLTFGCDDAQLGEAMERAVQSIIKSSPRVMRELPRLLPKAGLRLTATQAHVYAEAGSSRFLLNLAETYGPLAASTGVVPAAQADAWLADQRRSAEDGTFFAACNYYAYVAQKAA